MRNDNISYTKEKNIVVMGDNGTYTKECNLVSWNQGTPKLDLRLWKEGKPLKGITLDENESKALYEGLKAYYECDKTQAKP